MNLAEVTMILSLLITVKTTMEQQPENCFCHVPDGTLSCDTRGCSNGYNDFCANGFLILYHDQGGNLNGCNCPKKSAGADHGRYTRNQHSGRFADRDRHGDRQSHNANRHRGTHNGYVGHLGYNYNTCTAFGGNARNSRGHVPADANSATKCCNFCCGRNDPEPFPTASAVIPTNRGHKMVSNETFYLTVLIMLIVIALKMN